MVSILGIFMTLSDRVNQRLLFGISAALHVVGMALCALFLCARAWTGRLGATSRATLDNVNLMWHYTTLQGIAVALLVQLLPKVMG